MYEEVLQQIGLSKNQAIIYQVLLREGEASVGTIALRSKIHRRNVYDYLKSLIGWGLVFPIVGRTESSYAAADPQTLLDIIEERGALLADSLPQLESIYRKSSRSQEVYVYQGAEGWKNYMRDILRVNKPAYFIAAKGGWLDARVKDFFPYFIAEARKQKLRFYHLFDYEVKERVPEILSLVGKDYRFLPKEFGAVGAVDIFGDHTNLISEIKMGSQPDQIRFTVIVNPDIAESFRIWFRFLWDKCSSEK